MDWLESTPNNHRLSYFSWGCCLDSFKILFGSSFGAFMSESKKKSPDTKHWLPYESGENKWFLHVAAGWETKPSRQKKMFLCLLYTGQSPGLSSLHKTIFTVLYSMTIFVAVVGNLLLIFIIKRRPETRSLTGFLFVNMAVADLLVALIAMPVTLHILHGGGV